MRRFSPGTPVSWYAAGIRLSGTVIDYDASNAVVYANGSTYHVVPELLQAPQSKRRAKYGRIYTRHDPEDVLRYIVRYKLAHDGNSPTVRQICEAMDISSTSVCGYILQHLQRAGRIVIPDHGASRGIEIVGGYQNFALSEDK